MQTGTGTWAPRAHHGDLGRASLVLRDRRPHKPDPIAIRDFTRHAQPRLLAVGCYDVEPMCGKGRHPPTCRSSPTPAALGSGDFSPSAPRPFWTASSAPFGSKPARTST